MWIMGSGLMDCELLYPHAEYQEQAPGSPFLACQLHFLKQWPPPHLQWKLNFLTGDNSGKKKKKKTCWDKLLKKNIPHYNAYHNSPWPWAVQYFPPLPLHETVYHQIQSEMHHTCTRDGNFLVNMIIPLERKKEKGCGVGWSLLKS